jgi:hypothetical protein
VAGLNDCALTIKDCQPNDDVLVRVKYWEIIADNLSKAGWSLGYQIKHLMNHPRCDTVHSNNFAAS